MIELGVLIAFIGISFGFIAMPGPNVLVVISASLNEGLLRAFQTIAGVSLAMALQLLIAVVGTSWLVNTLASGFQLIKWLGVAYLLYLALQNFMLAYRGEVKKIQRSALVSFSRGFFISLSNPKTIVFFAAFLPQFTNGSGNYHAQIILLSSIFWCLALLVNSSYALLAARLSHFLNSPLAYRLKHSASGFLFLIASVFLGATEK